MPIVRIHGLQGVFCGAAWRVRELPRRIEPVCVRPVLLRSVRVMNTDSMDLAVCLLATLVATGMIVHIAFEILWPIKKK